MTKLTLIRSSIKLELGPVRLKLIWGNSLVKYFRQFNAGVEKCCRSSTDETYAAWNSGLISNEVYQSDVFKDQFEWIHDLIAEFSNCTGITLIIRLHPREYHDNLLPSFPEQFYTSGNSKNDYFVNLRNELEFPKIRKLNSLLYSCLAYSGLQGTIKLRGGFQQNRVVRFSSLLSRLIRRIYFGQPDLFKWIELRLPVRKSNQSRVFEILQEKGSSSRGGWSSSRSIFRTFVTIRCTITLQSESRFCEGVSQFASNLRICHISKWIISRKPISSTSGQVSSEAIYPKHSWN